MTIGPSSDTNTRDVAVIANTKIDQHVQDCINFRMRIDKRFDEQAADNKEKHDDLKSIIKEGSKSNINVNWIAAGAIILLMVLMKVPPDKIADIFKAFL